MLIVTGIDKSDSRLIKKYARFVLSRFIKPSVFNKSIITINVIEHASIKDKADQKAFKKSGGWASYDGRDGDKRKFTVTMNKSVINNGAKTQVVRLKNLLKYLGHELCHVKQYLNHELFDYSDGEKSRFLGNVYTYNPNELDWTYWESPWEIEAHGRMEGFYQMFLEQLKIEKAKKL
jgi:hypothetical protein